MTDSAPQSVRSSASNHGRIVTENPSLLSLLKEKTDENLKSNRQSTHTHSGSHGGARSNSKNQNFQRENSETNLRSTNKHASLDSNSDSLKSTADKNLDSRVTSPTIADIAEDNIFKGKVKFSQIKNAEEDSALDLGFDSPEAGLQTYRVPSPVSQVIPYIESPKHFRDSLEKEAEKTSGDQTGRRTNSPIDDTKYDNSEDQKRVDSVTENVEGSSENKNEGFLHPEIVGASPRHTTPRHERFSAGRSNTRTSTSSVYAVANPDVLVAQGDTPTQQNVQFTPRVETANKEQNQPSLTDQSNKETGEVNEPTEKLGSGKSGKPAHVSFQNLNDTDLTDRASPVDRENAPSDWDTPRRTDIQERVPTPHPYSPSKSPEKSRKSPVNSPVYSFAKETESRNSHKKSESKNTVGYKSEKSISSLPTVKRVYIDSPTFTKDEENEYRFVESRLEEGNEDLDKTFRELEHISPKRHKSLEHRNRRKMDESYSAQQRQQGGGHHYDQYDDRRDTGDQYDRREEEQGSYADQYDRRSNHARDNDQYEQRSNHARDNDQYDERSNHARDNDQYDRRSNHNRDSGHKSDHVRENERGSYADEYAKRDDRSRDRERSYDGYEDRVNGRGRTQSVDRYADKNNDRDRIQSDDRYDDPISDGDQKQNGDRFEDRDQENEYRNREFRDRDDEYRNQGERDRENRDRYEDRNEKMEDSQSHHSGQYRQENRYERRRDDETPPADNYTRHRYNTNMDDDLEREREYQDDLRHRIDSQSKRDSELVIPKLPLNMESEDFVQDSLDYETGGNNDWGNPPPNPYGGYEERGNAYGGYHHQQRGQQYDDHHQQRGQQYDVHHQQRRQQYIDQQNPPRQRGVQEYIEQLDTARMEILNPTKPKYDYVENNKIDYGRVRDKSYRSLVERKKEAEEKLEKLFVSPKGKPKQQRQLNKVGANQFYSPLTDYHSEHQMSTAEEMWAKRSVALSKKKSKTSSGTIKKTQGLQKYPSDSGLFRPPGQSNGPRMYGTPTRNHFLEPIEQRPPPPPQINDDFNRQAPLPPQGVRSSPFKKPLELKPITQQIVTEDGQRISVDINLKVVSPPPPHSQMGPPPPHSQMVPPQIEATVIPRADFSPDRRPTGHQYQMPYLQQDQAEMMTTYAQYEEGPPEPPPQQQQQLQYGRENNFENPPHYQQGYYGYDDSENIPPPSHNMDGNRQIEDGGYGQTSYSPYNTIPPINLDKEHQPGQFDENGYAAMYKREKEKNPNDQPWYQVYTIKDYRKMVKEVKLNRGTLGPDLDNETYKEKLEKRYKQVDYARMVMEKNRQDYGDRKPPAFPKPKEQHKEETKKRQAALDYARNVPKPIIKQKPNQYNSYEVASQLSPLNKRKSPVQKVQAQTVDVIDLKKLQQRHEQDKQNVASIRQNIEA